MKTVVVFTCTYSTCTWSYVHMYMYIIAHVHCHMCTFTCTSYIVHVRVHGLMCTCISQYMYMVLHVRQTCIALSSNFIVQYSQSIVTCIVIVSSSCVLSYSYHNNHVYDMHLIVQDCLYLLTT